MTLELDTLGPGIDDYRSSLFTVEVPETGESAYVYSYSRATQTGFVNQAWSGGETVELSWVKYGSDTQQTITVSLISGAITSIAIYPPLASDIEIVDGDATFAVPAGVNLRIEVNGDRANVLHIFARSLATAPVGTTVTWESLGLDVSGMDFLNDEVNFGAAHGLNEDDIVIARQDAGSSVSVLTDLGLAPFTRYSVGIVDADTVTLTNVATGDAVDLTEAEDFSLKFWKCSYANTGATLVFERGLSVVGHDFDLADNVDLYFNEGAVVVGGYNITEEQGVTWAGPGHISGEFATYESIASLPYADRAKYAIFNGWGDSTGFGDNSVSGVTVFATPFFCATGGIYSFEEVQIISPWTFNTDSFLTDPQNGTTYATRVVNCFSFVSDDAIHLSTFQPTGVNRTITGNFVVNGAGCCFHFSYHPYAARNEARTFTVSDNDAMNLIESSSNGAILRAWLDGWSYEEALGVYDVDIEDLRVWGPVGRVLDLQNKLYPFGTDIRQARGQIAYWTFTNISIEQEPSILSLITGYDATSTPHDISFSGYYVADTLLTATNVADYITLNSFPYNITYGAIVIPDPPDPPDPGIVTDPDDTLANSYCTVAVADAYHVAYGSPVAWTGSTTAQKEQALRSATRDLDIVYGGRWAGRKSDEDQVLDWPRTGVVDSSGYSIDDDSVPTRLQEATAYAALLIRQGYDLLAETQTSADIRSESINASGGAGSVSRSVTYIGGKPSTTLFPRLDRMLSSYSLITGGSGARWGAVL